VVAVLHHFESGQEPQISKQWEPDPDYSEKRYPDPQSLDCPLAILLR
jgi:hypothetical protein